jgi:hypothetical protein
LGALLVALLEVHRLINDDGAVFILDEPGGKNQQNMAPLVSLR